MDFVQQKLEILDALAKLGEVLTRDEQIFLAEHADSAAKHFAAAKNGNISEAALSKTINTSKRVDC